MIIPFFFSTLLFFMVAAFIFGAPLVPSKKGTAEKMVELLKVKPGEVVYDLGSGDGRLLNLIAQKGGRAVGIEINPYAILYAYFQAARLRILKNITIYWGNYWWRNISKADKVAVYILPYIAEKLVAKCQKELKPGTLIVSNTFKLPRLKLVKEATVGQDRIYLYRV